VKEGAGLVLEAFYKLCASVAHLANPLTVANIQNSQIMATASHLGNARIGDIVATSKNKYFHIPHACCYHAQRPVVKVATPAEIKNFYSRAFHCQAPQSYRRHPFAL
tara:strand:+ start:79 stop:399 length:321 start_codon:yes stop_codon:yes gene_type:complete